MISPVERVTVLEVHMANTMTKLSEISVAIRELHTCLDQVQQDITEKLEKTQLQNNTQHAELALRVSDLDKFKNKWTYTLLGGFAVFGWISGHMNAIAGLLK